MTTVLGIDFGTTNSVIAALDTETGQVTTARFTAGGAEYDVFRSVLCFWTEPEGARSLLRHAAGPAAIETYLDDPLDSRLVMSTKTYLASRSFTSTALMGRVWTLEQMIGLFLRELAKAAKLDPAGLHVVVGRPVRFAGDQADDEFGVTRLRARLCRGRLSRHRCGTGTRSRPDTASPARSTAQPPFWWAISAAAPVTSPSSGLTRRPPPSSPPSAAPASASPVTPSTPESWTAWLPPCWARAAITPPGGNALPVPVEWYTAFARWHRLSLMRSPRTLRDIAEVRRTAEAPELLDHLLSLIEDEQGYGLYRAVSDAKAALSRADSTVLRFRHGAFTIEQPIARSDFEAWIEPDLARMDTAITESVAAAGMTEAGIDRVFLTGGTAFVPAVRALFERRFGAARVSGGGEFVSVAEGLALIGADRGRV